MTDELAPAATAVPDPCAPEGLDVGTALALILLGVEAVPGEEAVSPMLAAGRVLLRDLRAPAPLPPFRNAAMDGYLLAEADLACAAPFTLPLAGQRFAGDAPGEALRPGTTIRILTGAVVPPGGAAVMYQERCERRGDAVTFHETPRSGANIRGAGEDANAGATLLEAGTRLGPQHLALAGAAGAESLPLRRRVRVGLMSTGSELAQAGAALRPGQIHDSNRPMLAALLAAPFVSLQDFGAVPDRPDLLARTLRDAGDLDLLVTTGAVAGSEADHLPRAIALAGGSVAVQRLALRPGKPLLHGWLGQARVLGFGGNPLAGFVGASLFAVPLIRALAGLPPAPPRGRRARLEEAPGRRADRREFRPARLLEDAPDGALLRCLGPGGSARLLPLASADGLAEMLPGEPLRVRFHPFATLQAGV